MNLHKYNLKELSKTEKINLFGGNPGQGTLADEIGYVIGAIAGWFASDDYYHSNIRPEGGYL